MHILGLPGSLRASSTNAALVRATAALAPAGVTFHVYSGLEHLPLFSPDLDTADPPTPVVDLRAHVAAADAVLICTPEYAYGMPGSLKNALDWLVSSAGLYHKPVAALSASPSPGGGERALAWLCQTLTALDAFVPEAATFPIPFVKQKLEGDRVTDEPTAQRLGSALALLAALVADAA